VDVILRRLDDGFCDPLELRHDSALGVAGLVEAVRAGHVTVANALGSGLVETAAMGAFLPGLCRALLGEELLLPQSRSWWCGHPDDLQYVLAHLEELVIKPAFPSATHQPVFGRALSGEQRRELRDVLLARPESFVAQTEVALSTAPVWDGHGAAPRQLVLRTYATSTGDAMGVLPGGLTRVGPASEIPIVTMQRGGGSKDTWVVSDEPETAASLLAPTRLTVKRERLDASLPSRVADNLFWLGRQVERAEQTVRLLRSLVKWGTREDTTEETPELVALLDVLARLELTPPELRGRLPLHELQHRLSMLFRLDVHPAVLQTTLGEVRRVAATVRDRLSLDTWRILNQLQQDVRLRQGRLQFYDVFTHLNRVIADLAAFSGMEMENMTRGHGWLFLDLGRRIERSLALTQLVSVSLDARPSHIAMLEPLLDVADSAITYRRRYFAEAQLPPVLDLLLADGTNPRALAFQLNAMASHLEQLPRDSRAPALSREAQLIAHAVESVANADFDALSQPGADVAFDDLTRLLETLDEDVRGVSDAITFHYFSHAEQRVS
jgi:uncharacterized alpha-E superfamily protein